MYKNSEFLGITIVNFRRNNSPKCLKEGKKNRLVSKVRDINHTTQPVAVISLLFVQTINTHRDSSFSSESFERIQYEFGFIFEISSGIRIVVHSVLICAANLRSRISSLLKS